MVRRFLLGTFGSLKNIENKLSKLGELHRKFPNAAVSTIIYNLADDIISKMVDDLASDLTQAQNFK